MKKAVVYIGILFVMFAFSGCRSYTINYNGNLTQYNLNKNIDKIEDVEVNIVYPKGEVAKRPNSFEGGALKNHFSNKLNALILKDAMSQYFENVDVVELRGYKVSSYLKIEAKLSDIEFAKSFSGANSTYTIDVKVYLGNRIILDKRYEEFRSATRMVTGGLFRNFSAREWQDEDHHKQILSIYQDNFIPDLLKALKENI